MGNQKLSHKTVFNSYLPLQKFQGLAGVDSRFVKFKLTFLFRIFLHCFDCTQTHSIVAYLIKKGVPVIEWTTLSEKNRFGAKKRQRNGFLEFSHFTARKHLAILLFCSDYAQT